jgi:hypothetical protein
VYRQIIQQATGDIFPNQMQIYNGNTKLERDSLPLQALEIKHGKQMGPHAAHRRTISGAAFVTAVQSATWYERIRICFIDMEGAACQRTQEQLSRWY